MFENKRLTYHTILTVVNMLLESAYITYNINIFLFILFTPFRDEVRAVCKRSMAEQFTINFTVGGKAGINLNALEF